MGCFFLEFVKALGRVGRMRWAEEKRCINVVYRLRVFVLALKLFWADGHVSWCKLDSERRGEVKSIIKC
jgi:hypothetical protein